MTVKPSFDPKSRQLYGIVSTLDDAHHARIEHIWSELQDRFDVQGIHQTPVPHFSYHVATQYDTDELPAALLNLCGQFEPFTVRTAGLGIFTGEHPTLYVLIKPTEALLNLHKQLWEVITPIATEPSLLYHPNRWIPHITLTEYNIDHELLPQVIRLLTERDFFWTIHVEKLSLLGSSEGEIDTLHNSMYLGTPDDSNA